MSDNKPVIKQVTLSVECYDKPNLYLRTAVASGSLGDKKFNYDNILPAGHLLTIDDKQYVVTIDAMIRALTSLSEPKAEGVKG